MGEIKSVKVDNWGVFFLQKLQNFFNKTDYCDLTLQFRDNSQLKVHRLVLSACTDYFNVLEQKCEVVDDAIIMPNGLQADVVVPIVNFMYTGTLEFELKMYNRLLKTAKDMNMTVLLKLLEAHRRTMEMHPQKTQAPSSPKMRRKPGPVIGSANTAAGRSLIAPQQQRRIIVGENNTHQQQPRNVQTISHTRVISSSGGASNMPVKQQIGSTTFTRIKQEPEQDENHGSGGGYTVLKKPNQQQQQMATSPFEQLRKGYSNNKRPAATSFISPPAKKPNLEDVKEFAEQQRMRKQIAAEFGDDGDYDAGIMDDDTIHNDDDDDDVAAATTPSSASAAVQTSTTQQHSEDPPGTTTIIVKHEGPDKPPTIVVKDSANSKMNHAKIISEVLRQYPHLVNSNKNIKLKIMPNAGGQTQKIIVKKEPVESDKQVGSTASNQKTASVQRADDNKTSVAAAALVTNKPRVQTIQSAFAPTQRAAVGSSSAQPIAASSTQAAAPPQKRRIDSKTMHALIALGAENTTGPWLCLRCGRNGHPISIPSYRGFRRHLINTHKETIDPALCEHCGWRSGSKRELHFHMQLEHKIKTNLYIFPECQLCQQMCIDSDALNQHLIDSHPDENKQQCIYCNKIFPEELQLYTHMKTFHKKQALEDGIIDYSDDENTNAELAFPPPLDDHEMEVDHAPPQEEEKKIKILSDISLPIASSIIKTDSLAGTTEQVLRTGESTTSVGSEEYLQENQEHVETKFVAADGSEVILTDEQRKEILSQLNQENDGSGVVMVLNENQHYAGGETQSEQGILSHDETSQATTATNDEQDDHDDSQIYSELKPQRQEATEEEEDTTSQMEPESAENIEERQKIEKEDSLHHDTALDESKESTDNLEWAENLISEHDMADEMPESSEDNTIPTKAESKIEEPKDDDEEDKSQEDISEKLKELAGEWSENDEDDDDIIEESPAKKQEEIPQKSQDEIVTETEEKEAEHHDIPETEKVPETDEEKEGYASTKTTEVETEIKAIESMDKADDKETELEHVDPKTEPLVEDDVDLALKSLHKENDDNKDTSIDNEEEEQEKMETETVIEKASVPVDIKEVENVDHTSSTEANVEDKNMEDILQATVSSEQCDASTSLKEEETKKDLIDMLLSEHAETVEELKSEVVDTVKKEEKPVSENIIETETAEVETQKTIDNSAAEVKPKTDCDSAATESATQGPLTEDEFLDVTPEKIVDDSNVDALTAEVSSAGPEAPPSPSTTEKDTVTSEERVKSLISEWGDDEDEDDNDAELKASL